MPAMQLVVAVTFEICPRVVPWKNTALFRKRCSTPGPRMPASRWKFVLIPNSLVTLVPPHPVAALARPVMVQPFGPA